MSVDTVVVGLGKIAQLKYLPALSRHPDIQITGLVDAAPSVLAAVGDQTGVDVNARFQHIDELPAHSVDLIIVLTHDHFEVASAAVRHGAAVFVEKPLCWSSTEAHKLATLSAEHATPCIASQFRRFDPHLTAFRDRIRELGPPLFVRASNLAGGVKAWAGPDDGVLRPNKDEKAAAARELDHAWRRVADGTTGQAQTLLQLGIHDLNVIDYVFGPITGLASVTAGPSAAVTACLTVADGVACTVQVAPLFDAPWMWRQSLEAVYPRHSIRVEFGNPFLPVNLTRLIETGPGLGQTASRCLDARDPFNHQLDHVVEVIRDRETDDSAEVAVRDLTVIENMLERMC